MSAAGRGARRGGRQRLKGPRPRRDGKGCGVGSVLSGTGERIVCEKGPRVILCVLLSDETIPSCQGENDPSAALRRAQPRSVWEPRAGQNGVCAPSCCPAASAVGVLGRSGEQR
ncbi:unnamed protein product [Coccothraustes coccothraustes]